MLVKLGGTRPHNVSIMNVWFVRPLQPKKVAPGTSYDTSPPRYLRDIEKQGFDLPRIIKMGLASLPFLYLQ